MRTLASARLKRIRALELAARGLSYDEVARAVGYSHRGSAYRAVFTALDEREVVGVEQLRTVELARLDRLQATVWEDAMAGDPRAVSAAVRVIQQRVRLMGLDRVGSELSPLGPSALVIGAPEGNPGEATDELEPGAPT